MKFLMYVVCVKLSEVTVLRPRVEMIITTSECVILYRALCVPTGVHLEVGVRAVT